MTLRRDGWPRNARSGGIHREGGHTMERNEETQGFLEFLAGEGYRPEGGE